MALLKKKTRKAVRKSFKKVINKHAPIIAAHLATVLAAGLTAYIGADEGKSRRKLKKAVKRIPGGKKIVEAIISTFTASDDDDSHARNGHGDKQRQTGRGEREQG